MSWYRILSGLVFLAVVSTVVYGAHTYLYRRLVRDVALGEGFRKAGLGLLAMLAVSIVLWPFTTRVFPTTAGDLLSRLGFLWMGLAFYLLVSVGLADVVRTLVARGERRKAAPLPAAPRAEAAASPPVAPQETVQAPPAQPLEALAEAQRGSLGRRELLARTAAVGATSVAAAVTSYGVWRSYAPARVTEVAVKLPGLPPALSGMTLVQLSDIHVGVSIDRRFVVDMVERVNALKPDLVAITGDLVDGSVAHLFDRVAELQRLRSRYGSYFCTGNHDYYSGEREWCAALEKLGVVTLRNRFVPVGDTSPGGATFDLVGVDDWKGDYDLEKATAGRDPARAGVLLAHQPRGFREAYARGIGLQLSGHTHGGQFYPWALVVQAVYPQVAGMYQGEGGQLYVSRGTGFWGPPVRVGAPPEIVKLVLTS